MTALTCPICGRRPKRDDRGDDIDQPNISMGYRAVLKCDCGLRLERFCAADQSASELTQIWRSLVVR